jgi:hypothetical protein
MTSFIWTHISQMYINILIAAVIIWLHLIFTATYVQVRAIKFHNQGLVMCVMLIHICKLCVFFHS